MLTGSYFLLSAGFGIDENRHFVPRPKVSGYFFVAATRTLSEYPPLSKDGVRLALDRLGLAWRLRRCKAAIAKKYVPARLSYCLWLLKEPQADLNRWAYVDGTSF